MSHAPTLAAPDRVPDAHSPSRTRAREILVERIADWSPERSLDSGDSHDKGELSLCVGEAA
jgi:hypothetical protein